jgi:hypothetical protein
MIFETGLLDYELLSAKYQNKKYPNSLMIASFIQIAAQFYHFRFGINQNIF